MEHILSPVRPNQSTYRLACGSFARAARTNVHTQASAFDVAMSPPAPRHLSPSLELIVMLISQSTAHYLRRLSLSSRNSRISKWESKGRYAISVIVQSPNYCSVVFSYWTSTLDLVERSLKEASIRCVRFDGQMSLKQRQHAVKQFRTEPFARVMLLTLGCGAAG
jgi:SNF2 family DNA or RNA helicase